MISQAELDALKKLCPALPLNIEHDNDTGPGDEGFWEWWEVNGLKFNTEKEAKDYVKLMTALPRLIAEVEKTRQLLDGASAGGIAAADELMTEFVSKKRAANWGIINEGLVACNSARRFLDETQQPTRDGEEGK